MNRLSVVFLTTVFLILGSVVLGDDLKDYLSTFMSKNCCFTNNCCFPISHSDVVDLGNNRFKIVASGQEVNATGFSPDGKYWRCACDLDMNGGWKVHLKANTRCLYIPFQGS